MNPNYVEAHIQLTRVYTLRHEYDKAIAHARKAVEIGGRQRALAFLGYALGMAGRRAEANEILQDLKNGTGQEHGSPWAIAIVYIGLGDREAAFPLLEEVSNQHTNATLRSKTEPILDPLRADPRFNALLRHAGFGS